MPIRYLIWRICFCIFSSAGMLFLFFFYDAPSSFTIFFSNFLFFLLSLLYLSFSKDLNKMSTRRSIRDNLPTVAFDTNNSKSLPQSEEGASEARRLSDPTTSGTCNGKTKAKGEDSPAPDFSPAYVKIPFEDIELGDCCGEGSFGTVYKAKWKSQGGKDIAVKTLNRMDEEVKILSTLSHRNIIQFYGACCEVPNYCLVTEYAPYGSLYCFLASPKSEQLEFVQMLSWAGDVALGMNYLHEEAPIQVVHRDLKSKNVLICQDFSLKICDFGASRVFDETTVMTITGTYPWMAPELIQGLPTSETCDVYSFAVVLWELLTKEVPFKGLQGFQVAWNVVEKKERPLIPTTCPERLSNLMQMCWQADASERPPFSDIIPELNQMLTDGELEKQTDSFVHTKSDWIQEVKTKLKDIRHQESELVAEKGPAKEREEIMKQWAERLENELKQKSLFNFQYSTSRESFNCEYSETKGTSSGNVRDVINRMMFSSGRHRHSKEEKFGRRIDGFSPSNGTSPLFGMPLSRQGSSSSMESSRSMSMHSDMAYDMSKVSIESSPVAFMDSTDGFPFPKTRGEQHQTGGRSRMKLQKQMSASSEEFQFEGVKMSMDNTLTNGNSNVKAVGEWEKSSSKSKVNQSNESLEVNSDTITNQPPFVGSNYVEKVNIIPSADILEKALKSMNLKKSPINDVATFAVQLHERLELIMRENKSTPSPLSDEFDNGNSQSFTSLSPSCKCQRIKRSPPFIKNMPSFPTSQKPPIKFSPTKVIDTEDILNPVRHRPRRCIAKNIDTQTEPVQLKRLKSLDASTQTCSYGNVVSSKVTNGKKKVVNYLHHVPCLERVCIDVPVCGEKDNVTANASFYGKSNTDNQSFDVKEKLKAPNESKSKEIIGQVFDNSVSRHRGIRHHFGMDNNPRKVSLPARMSPPKSLLLNQCNSPGSPSPDEGQIPRHAAARQVFLTSRANSADIIETDDFTYIIRPNRRRR
ncbi:uncharacterized protein LOC120347945 [Styela clava]